MRILVIEDEIDLNNTIVKYLKKENFSVDSILDGGEALDYIRASSYDVILLDIMLPNQNGYEILKTLREEGFKTPVLFLTAKDTLADKVRGLDLGADDYLVKPFHFSELLARVRALIRRHYGNVTEEVVIPPLSLNLSQQKIFLSGKEIDLSAKEYEVLAFFMQNKNRILSREQIREHIWDFEYEGESNVIDVVIKNIRKKLGTEAAKLIETKRGLGYVLQEKKMEME